MVNPPGQAESSAATAGPAARPVSDDRALVVYVAEYNNLSEEINSRFESQRLSFTVTITLLGGAIAAVTGKDFALNAQARAAILLAIPIMVTSAAAIFFDNELMIYRCGARIFGGVRDGLVLLTGNEGIMKRTCAPNAIDRIAQIAFSFARWLLFLAGPVVATAALIRHPDLFPRSGPTEEVVFQAGIALEVLLAIGMVISLYLQLGRPVKEKKGRTAALPGMPPAG